MPLVAESGGYEFEFPDGTTPEQMAEAIGAHIKQASPAPYLESTYEQPPPDYSAPTRLGAGVLSGLHSTVRGAEQLGAYALRGLGMSEQAQSLEEAVGRQRQEAGSFYGPITQDTTAGAVGEVGGNVLGTLLPGMGAERLAMLATKSPKAIQLLREAVSKYGATSSQAKTAAKAITRLDKTLEASRTIPAATASGAVGGAMQDTEDKTTATALGSGFGAATDLGLKALGGVGGAAASLLRPFFKEGKKQAAGEVISDLAPDLSKKTPEKLGIPRTLGQETQDPGILAFEKSLAAKDQQGFGAAIQERRTRGNQIIQEKLESLAPTGQALDVENAVAQSVAGKRAKLEKAAEIEPPALADQAVTSQAAAESLKQAYDTAKKRETALWQQVPKEISSEPEPLMDAFKAMRKATPKAQLEDLPMDQFRILNSLINDSKRTKQPVPVSELHAIRSKLLEKGRVASAAGEANKARLARDSAALVKLHMDELSISSPQYDEARKFTSKLHDTFDMNKPLSASISRTEAGASRILDSKLLDKVVASPEDTTAYLAAIGNDAVGRQALRDHVISKAGKSKAWADKSASVIDAVPGARTQIKQNAAIGERIKAVSAHSKALETAINMGPEKFFLRGDPEKAVRDLMAAKDSQARLSRLQNLLKDDPAAQEGLKALVAKEFVERVRNPGSPDTAGSPTFSPAKAYKELNKNRQFLFSVFKEDWQRRILQSLPSSVRQMESIRSASAVGGAHTAELGQAKAVGDLVLHKLFSMSFPAILRAVKVVDPYGPSEEAIVNLVKEGLLNPELGRSLAEKASKKNLEKAAKAIESHLSKTLLIQAETSGLGE